MSIRNSFQRLANNYLVSKGEAFAQHETAILVRDKLPKQLSEVVGTMGLGLSIKGSVGQGNWSEVPWLAFLDEIVTDTTTRGYYVVYLFSSDMKSLYLCIGQGVTAVKSEFGPKWRNILNQRAEIIRARLQEYPKNFEYGLTPLHGRTTLAKGYEASEKIHVKYDLLNLPDEGHLVLDLVNMLQLYQELILAGGTDLVESGDEDQSETGAVMTLEEKRQFSLHRRWEGRARTEKVKKVRGYTCEACGFNFQERYGELGLEYIEAHHLIPYSELKNGEKRTLDIAKDFVVLCANCHRMIHRMELPSDLTALRKLVLSKGK